MTFDSNKEKAVEALKNELAGEKLHAEQTKQKPQKKSVVITLEPQSPKPCQPKALNAQQPRASILDGDSESANELPDPRLSVPIPSVSTKPFSSRITRQHSYERRLELEKLLKERREKENLTRISLLVSGHVDAGKSTLLGHLLVLVGKVSNQTIQVSSFIASFIFPFASYFPISSSFLFPFSLFFCLIICFLLLFPFPLFRK